MPLVKAGSMRKAEGVSAPRAPGNGGPGLIWFREAREPSQRPTLSRGEITRAAVELADAGGIQAVSMRRIAARLGAGATSLYWYVASKEDLFELMADEVIGEIPLPGRQSPNWRQNLRTIARTTRATLKSHPWVVQLGIQPGLGPKTQRYARAALGAFTGLRLDLAMQIEILAALNNYLFGFVHREVARAELTRRLGIDEASWRARFDAYVEEAEHHDGILAQQMRIRADLHDDRNFEFGLDCMLRGIEAHVTSGQGDEPYASGV
jgi:AcrR family transcriptional regulator